MHGYDGRKRILAALMRTVEAAKDALGMEQLAKLATQLFKLKADMEGTAVAWREDIAAAIKKDEELQKFINEDERLAKLVKQRGDYDPASVYASLNHAVELLEKSFLKTKEQEKQIGDIKLSRTQKTETADDVIAAAKERLEGAKAELEAAEEALKEATKNAKDTSKAIAKTNIEKLYREAIERAKDIANQKIDESKKPKEAPKKEAPAPGKGIGDIKKLMDDKKKEKAPAASSLDGTVKTAADSEAAFSAALDEIKAATDAMQAGVQSAASAVEKSDAAIDGAVAAAAEVNQMMESAPEESADEADEAEESDEPGMMDQVMDFLSPAPQMEMAPVPASNESAWFKESSLTAEADVKHFPSAEDMSCNSLELVEGDGKQHLVVKKDLKSKVTQKIQDHLSGKYRKAEKVALDLGDRIVEASMVGYIGEGRYEVVAEGRSMKVPAEQVFRAADIWGA